MSCGLVLPSVHFFVQSSQSPLLLSLSGAAIRGAGCLVFRIEIIFAANDSEQRGI